MNAIKQDVELLVQKELESANKKFPQTFRSRHEAYGVMMEEFEEAQDELLKCQLYLNEFKYSMKVNGYYLEKENLNELKERSENLMAEAGQLAAMAQKALNSTEEWYKDGIISRKEKEE